MDDGDRPRDRVVNHGRRPGVVAPDLEVVEPLTRFLLAVDEQRRGDGDATDPDEDDVDGRSTFADVCLHGEDDAEETIARYQRQRQDA